MGPAEGKPALHDFVERMSRAAARWGARQVVRACGPSMRVPWGIARGVRLERDETTTATFPLGLYEIELAPSVRRLCRPGTRSFDIGSLNGYYALVFSRLSGAPVVAFDFDAGACARIARNLAANPVEGARVTVERLYLAYETNPAANAITLDAYVAARGLAPDLLKIDVEGAEAGLLSGARQVLAEHGPALIVETHSPELEESCAALLAEAGYRPEVVETRRRPVQRRRTTHNRWLVAPRRDRRD